ncbi:hypothetical protein E2562_023138 [Oryza meyeriana var. granulata]|uniref:Uncharacterized protein n=1 Tax=Oryza meyeriana var. granulata TaxID=110450 RepID=A0A6G1E2P0_9ORYZ|nr:hypothetical protein E2562_023138 [Oryza meyeriana var. granulata]
MRCFMPRNNTRRRRRRKKDFGMKFSELGEPDERFFVWKEDVGEERVESEHRRGQGSPVFAKWTVQKAAGGWWGWVETEEFYCTEVQGA